MAMDKGQNRADELEDYPKTSLNHVIHHRLTKGDRAGLFEPLEFFNRLNDLYIYTTTNNRNSSTLAERLNEMELTDGQKSFLLHYLDTLFLEDNIITDLDRQLDPKISAEDTTATSYQFDILVEWAKLQTPIDDLAGYVVSLTSPVRNYLHNGSPTPGGDELMRSLMAEGVKQRLRAAMQGRYNFSKIRKHLREFPNDKIRIAYLIERKAEYLQLGAISYLQLGATPYLQPGTPREYWSEGFDRKCELEITKLKKVMALESFKESRDEMQFGTKAVTRNSSGENTLARQLLAMSFLFTYTKVSSTQITKAAFIAFLTENSKEYIRQQLSDLYNVKKNNLQKWREDMQFVRKHFEALGLTEITKMIDNELDSNNKKL